MENADVVSKERSRKMKMLRIAMVVAVILTAGLTSGNAGQADYSWVLRPKSELTCEMKATVGVIASRSLLWSGPGLSFNPSGTMQKKGTTEYKADGQGCVIVWTRVEGGTNSFAWAQKFDWLKGKALTETNYLSGLNFISLQKKDGSAIVFAEAKVLAACSNPIRFTDGKTEHTFVVVFYGFSLKDTQGGGAGSNYTYGDAKVVFWPYEREFLEAKKNLSKEGEPEYEAADSLLSSMEKK